MSKQSLKQGKQIGPKSYAIGSPPHVDVNLVVLFVGWLPRRQPGCQRGLDDVRFGWRDAI